MNRAPRTVLLLALMGLAALFAGWFINDRHWLATQLVFTAPPLALAIARGGPGWARLVTVTVVAPLLAGALLETQRHGAGLWIAMATLLLAGLNPVRGLQRQLRRGVRPQSLG
jgi:hypothetical protein